MRVKLTEAEVLASVYDHVEIHESTASGPVAYSIPGRDDAMVCWALVEGKKTPLIAALFLVFKNKEGEIRIFELFSKRGLIYLGAREEGEYFIIKIGGPGIRRGVLRVPLAELGLAPQKKAAKTVVYH